MSNDVPPPLDPTRPYRIGLVCLGNICRSPMAEVVLRERLRAAGLGDSVAVESAGTGDWHVGGPMDDRALATLHDAGYDGSTHCAQQFVRTCFDRFDLVLAMDERNLAALQRLAPKQVLAEDRLRLFGSYAGTGPVPDPYAGGAEGFVVVLALVERGAREIVRALTGAAREQSVTT